MFAVVTIAGFQEMVQVGDKVRVAKLDTDAGKTVSFDQVLLVSDGKDATVGSPTIDGATVDAKVLSHGRDKKIRVFKMLRRKRYRRTHGHRQDFTEVEITKINAKGGAKKAAPKEAKAPAKKAAAKK